MVGCNVSVERSATATVLGIGVAPTTTFVNITSRVITKTPTSADVLGIVQGAELLLQVVQSVFACSFHISVDLVLMAVR